MITLSQIQTPPHITAVLDTFLKVFFGKFASSLNFWVAGGAVRDLIAGKRIHDLDVFFPGEQSRLIFERRLKEICRDRMRVNHDSATAVHIETLPGSPFGHLQIDSIKRYFGSPADTIVQFDYTVNCAAVQYNSITGQMLFTHHPDFFVDLAAHRLMVNKLPFPVDSLRRAFKYVERGFKICPGELQKVVDAIRSAPMAVVLPNGVTAPNGFYMVD